MVSSSADWNPNLTDTNRGPSILIVTTVFAVLITLSTGTRIITKLWCKVRLRIDDYLIILGYISNITCTALDWLSVRAGCGRHTQFLTIQQQLTFTKWCHFLILTACIALWAVKMSICFFLLSIIQRVYKRSRMVIWALITITTIASICQCVFWALEARPLRKLWEPNVPGTVASQQMIVVSIITFTAINSLTDLFYALSPLYFFGGLQMSMSRKVTVIGLTGSGLLVFTISIIRASFVKAFLAPDFTWALYTVYICTDIERNLAEIIADLPATYPHLRTVSKKALTMLGSRDQASTTSGYPPYRGSSRARSRTAGVDEEGKPRASRLNPFAAYGKTAQISQFSQIAATERDGREWSDDAIPLKSFVGIESKRRIDGDAGIGMGEAGIVVKTDVDVWTAETSGSGPGKGDL